jgi:hypothetical protein
MDKFDEIERSAMGLIRGAGRYGVYLTHLGFEVVGVADWLESQVPRVRRAVRAMADAAARELTGALEPEQDGDDLREGR